MTELEVFLESCPVFSGMSSSQIREVSPLFRTENYPAGTIILKQGGYSNAVYFLRSGRLAVRIRRGLERETVALLQPSDVFGELSFLTGRECVTDVEVVVDSEVVFLPRDAIPETGPQRDAMMLGLLGALATRLQVTMQRGATAAEMPVVLLRSYSNWLAPRAFAAELAVSLARQTGVNTLVIDVGGAQSGELLEIGEQAAAIGVPVDAGSDDIRVTVAHLLNELKRFPNVVLNIHGPDSESSAGQLQDLCNFRGYLLGAGDPLPEASEDRRHFIVQSAKQPTLPFLSGSRQLIYEEEVSETEHHKGKSVTPRFQRVVDSIARCIAGLQVGLALGGGAAWGWAHIGVLAALEEAGLPVDVIAGCSMGSVIGSLYATGRSIDELTRIAEYWRTRTGRFVEWRFWRMCLINERAVRKTFAGYFGDRGVNQTETPFWANTVDIERGEEYAIRDGTLVNCIRSSIALPGLLPPHSLPPRLLVDSSIMDPVPAALLRKMGCHYAVGVNAMAAPGTTSMSSRYPFNAFHLMIKCMFVMGHEIGQRAEKTADVVFTPEMAGINMLHFKRSAEIIERGRQATGARVPHILAGYRQLKEALGKREAAAGQKV